MHNATPNTFILSPSILSADFAHLENQIRAVEEAGADWIHIDVMDGVFVPNITMGPFIVSTCQRITRLPLDVHLMIHQPERHIQAFAEAGASLISIHIECNPNIHRTLQQIRDLGCRPAVAINPGTPAGSIEAVLDMVDMVLVMTVNPGFSGQVFLPNTVSKIAQVSDLIQSKNLKTLIQVDGGISAETLPTVYKNGARVIVAATSIFKHPAGIHAAVQALRDSIR
ncbi:MAG: ribulose-phosphate 3-epimerase [Anaerolineae bacterium]|nr:ribulose-phosphate 3-epimerase [Anaerolineae bacterium]